MFQILRRLEISWRIDRPRKMERISLILVLETRLEDQAATVRNTRKSREKFREMLAIEYQLIDFEPLPLRIWSLGRGHLSRFELRSGTGQILIR